MGNGNWIEGTVWSEGNIAAVFLINAGGSIIDHIPILFAVGIALGMSKDRDGSAALAGLVGFLVVTTMLSTDTVALLQGIDAGNVNAAFEDRKSTRLNSSHVAKSYAVFCLKKTRNHTVIPGSASA